MVPCRSVLANKHLKINPCCPTCKVGPDTIKHPLFECKLVSDVWKLLCIEDIIKRAICVDRVGEAILEHLICMM